MEMETDGGSSVFNNQMYREIGKQASTELNDYVHAAHCLVYAKWNAHIFNNIRLQTRAAVLMQMRSDGMLGFPGGVVNKGETITEGLIREMIEEINFDSVNVPIGDEHHVISHIHTKKKICLHFYVREVTMDQFLDMERRTLSSEDYGKETFGVMRVPLFTYADNTRGFPEFLCNRFIGNAKEQLLFFLLNFHVVSHEDLAVALKAQLALLKM